MKNSDSEFKDWLATYRPTLRHQCQHEMVDAAIRAMESPRPFVWWVEEECHRLRMELMRSFPDDRRDMLRASYQGSVMNAIKNRWDSIVKNRVAEMNPPKSAGTPNP